MEVEEYNKKIDELGKKADLIQDIINDRIEKALEKQIFQKIFKVVDVLGDTFQDYDNDLKSKYQDTKFTLEIESDFYQVDLSKDNIEHDYVFRGRRDYDIKRIDLYISDEEWETHLNSLYIKALETEKHQELKYNKEKLEKDMKKWKITEEML